MCAGAIYLSNIGQAVFGLREQRLRPIRDVSGATAALTMSCAAVLESGGHRVEITGGVLEDEAVEVHLKFWAAEGQTG